MTINAVCRGCNQGWLEDLENEATAIINALTVEGADLGLTERETRTLGYWAYVRALLLTHVYPRGRVPGSFFESAHADRETRAIPTGSYVSLGASTHLVFEAGAVQAATMHPGAHYLGFVGFGLGALVFLVAISNGSPEVSTLARKVIDGPHAWFPGSFRRLSPTDMTTPRLRLLTGQQAQLACTSMQLHFDSHVPNDQLGQPLDPMSEIPARFHLNLACMPRKEQ